MLNECTAHESKIDAFSYDKRTTGDTQQLFLFWFLYVSV